MKYILPYFLLLLVSCKELKPTEEPVAQVFEHVLYRSEIQDFLPKPISPDDSMALTQNYIRNWITQKLLLQKANENLSEKEKNVQKQVEDYRASLLIYKYKQKLIDQKLQENVSDAEMEAYYEKNQNNFVTIGWRHRLCSACSRKSPKRLWQKCPYTSRKRMRIITTSC